MSMEGAEDPGRILVLDVGGSHVKAYFSDDASEIKIESGPKLTPLGMVKRLRTALEGETYDAVAMGYPGLVRRGRIEREPHNLGSGWIGFDFEKALRRPVRIVNDAALQALGSYQGGRMLFLGLGTGLGSAMILDGELAPMELAHLPFKKGRTYEEYLGEAGLERLGRRRWQKEVFTVVDLLTAALEPDYVLLGGGNARKLSRLPEGVRKGDNEYAFLGGLRLWGVDAFQGPAAKPRRPAAGKQSSRRVSSRSPRS
jgi:predicted NBD/HSP70 family sugar kinase